MPGGVPTTLLEYPDGGIDGLGVVLSSVYNYVSPLLLSKLASPDVNMVGEKRGEQFATVTAGTPGSRVMGQNYMDSTGFSTSKKRTQAVTPVQVQSTASFDGTATLTYPTNYMRGHQGGAFANQNQFLNPVENLINTSFITDMRAAIMTVARAADKQMFKGIWGNNYVSRQVPGQAMTSTTETFASGVTHTPLVITTDLTAAGDPRTIGVKLINELKSARFQRDTNGFSLAKSSQHVYYVVPDFIFAAMTTMISCVNVSTLRYGAAQSDGTYAPVDALFSTFDGMTIIGLPYDDFYTVSGDTNNSYIGLAVVQDSIGWYSPKQNGNLVQMLRGFDAMPGFSMIPQAGHQRLAELIANNFAAGPNPALTEMDYMSASNRYGDPAVDMLRRGIAARYPDPFGTSYEGYYNPLCFGMYAYNMGPSTSSDTAWQTSLQINKFAGAVRSMPEYIVPIHINPALMVATPPTYSNPYTSTFAAAAGSDTQSFAAFAAQQPDLVSTQLKSEEPITVEGEEMLLRDFVDMKHGKDWMMMQPVQMTSNLLAAEEVSKKRSRRALKSALMHAENTEKIEEMKRNFDSVS